MIRLSMILAVVAPVAWADSYVAARTLRPQQVITIADVAPSEGTIPGAVSDLSEVIGKEARVAIFAGRPVFASDLSDAALIERNQIVVLNYDRGAVRISTEGRALDRAAIGDLVRVMNLSSRNTVTAQVMPDGTLNVH